VRYDGESETRIQSLDSRATSNKTWLLGSGMNRILGLPAVAVPTGVVGGVPIGVQITCPRFGECSALSGCCPSDRDRGRRLGPSALETRKELSDQPDVPHFASPQRLKPP
jgi:hypothetical protein